jgi:hypothetical protein
MSSHVVDVEGKRRAQAQGGARAFILCFWFMTTVETLSSMMVLAAFDSHVAG